MRRNKAEYINYDMFAGDKGGPEVRLNIVKLVKTRKEHKCVFLDVHTIPAGTTVRYEKGLVDGGWESYYCCIECMDKWLDEYDPDKPLLDAHENVLDRIDAWHEGDSEIPLDEFLGWSEDEYKLYMERNLLPEREVNR